MKSKNFIVEYNVVRTRHTEYFLPKVEMKDYNVKNDGRNVLDQPVKNEMRTYDNIHHRSRRWLHN